MATQPGKLGEMLETLAMFPDAADRAEVLLSFADKFTEVPPEVAIRPFARENQVPQCESDAYVWARLQPEGTLKFYFAVESPSGVSAKALATILDQALSGSPPEDVVRVDPEIVEAIFRENISMGKGLGLRSMVLAVQALARQALKTGTAPVLPES
ncbi:MAG: SufE family protein [Vicinamibacteraceae bacterium]